MVHGNNLEREDGKGDGKHAAQDHTAALHSDAYNPKFKNEQKMNGDGTIKHGQCLPGPKLNDLTIDTTPGHVVVHDVPKQGANYHERQEAAKREMPISNEHFRDLVKKGAEYMAINDGNFNLQMRNALDEANQSDKSMKTGHKHVDDMLKYVNSQLCDTFYTVARKGNVVEVYDTHNDKNHPAGRWNLDKKAWER